MSIIIGLADELERAANLLSTYGYTDVPSGRPMFPRAVNLLRAKAATLRKPKGKRGKARTVRAWVGKRKTKGNEIRIKTDRLNSE